MPTLFQFLYSQLITSYYLPKPTQSLSGKSVIVTGSNVGLGKEAARHFAAQGASTVILAVRSLEKGEAAKKDIESSTKCGKDVVQVWQLDMSSYQSVQDFAAKVEKELPRLDIALLNAGIFVSEFKMFEQDESTITVNVVSTFLLALLLLPKLKATANKHNTRPNLTITSSEVHTWAEFVEKDAPKGKLFDRLNEKIEGLTAMNERYQVSKLLEVFAVRAMADHAPASQSPVTINCVNPGFCMSELGREAPRLLELLRVIIGRSSEVGSRNLVAACLMGPESHGCYVTDCEVQEPAAMVVNAGGYELQERVWEELCTKLEGIQKGVTKNL